MKLHSFLVLTLYQDQEGLPVELWQQRGQEVLARYPLEACEAVLRNIIKRPFPEQTIVYVSLGAMRHPNGTPMAVQKYVATTKEREASNA